MKYFFGLVFLISGLESGIFIEALGYDHPDHYDYSYNQDYNADSYYLERPCAVYDLKCIREFFAKETGCTPVHEPHSDPVLKYLEMDIPQVNVTLELNNAVILGLTHGRVNTFFINKRTDSLVFEVVFDSLRVESLKTVVTQYLKGREPLESYDSTVAVFRDLSLTLNIRNIRDAKSIKSYVYAYVGNRYPLVLVGPGIIYKKKGPTLKWKYVKLVGLSAQEAMIKQAPVYMDLFLKTKICDFHINH